MLVNNSQLYASGDVVSIKLVNGDEIIGQLTEDSDGTNFAIDKPCVIVATQNGIGLIQALYGMEPTSSKTVVRVNTQHVMMHCEANQLLRDHYITTTTGIKPVTKGSIIV